jgi:7-dehydrocholesterol reductase
MMNSDLSFAAYQYQEFGFITNSMVIVNILHAFYVVDFFYNEDWYVARFLSFRTF